MGSADLRPGPTALLAWLVLCFAGCTDKAPPPLPPLGARVEDALGRVAAWMARYPEADLRFDAAVGLEALVATGRREFEPARRRARRVADADADNPMRRSWDEGATAAAESVRGWPVPAAGERRVNTNRPVSEALFCDRHGLRPETVAYLAGPMRDAGGYHSTHAVWALWLAQRRGCLAEARFREIAGALAAELRAAQPATVSLERDLDVDLFAERLWARLLLGEAPPPSEIEELLRHQLPGGAFGAARAPEPAGYPRFHASMMGAWALTLWLQQAGATAGGR